MPAPIILPDPLTGATSVGVTRQELRRYTGRAVGRHRVVAVGIGSDHPDAKREMVIQALAVDGQSNERLDGSYLYIPSGSYANESRQVLSGSFIGGLGSVLLDRPFLTTITPGTEVELSYPLPGTDTFDVRGLNQFVQEGLERVMIPLRLPMTATGDHTVDLGTDHSWLYDHHQILGIEDNDGISSSDPSLPSLYPVDVRRSGGTASLVLWRRYSAGETFTLVASIPADRYVFDGTSWVYPDPELSGLQYDTWQTAAPRDWVIPFAAAKALEYLIGETEMDESISDATRKRRLAAYERRYEKFVNAAADIKLRLFPRAPSAPNRPYFSASPAAVWSR